MEFFKGDSHSKYSKTYSNQVKYQIEYFSESKTIDLTILSYNMT